MELRGPTSKARTHAAPPAFGGKVFGLVLAQSLNTGRSLDLVWSVAIVVGLAVSPQDIRRTIRGTPSSSYTLICSVQCARDQNWL